MKLLLPPKTASGRGLLAPKKGLLAPKAAAGRASWRQAGLRRLLCLHDHSLDETSVRSTWLQMNFAACRLAASHNVTGSY